MPKQRMVGQELDKIYTDTGEFQLGAEAEDLVGNEYIFVEYKALSDDATEGMLAAGLDSAYRRYVVTADTTHGDAIRNDPRGQFQAALTDETFGWLQKKGYNRKAIPTDGTVQKDRQIMVSNATRGVATILSTNNKPCGTSIENDVSTSIAAGSVYLDC